jgi:drug/metabolite transporter (DMT)-like permease
MSPLALPLVLVVVGGVAYHLALKASSGGSPWAILTAAYGLAFVLCAGLWLRGGRAAEGLGRGALAVAAVLGLALVAIEGGYLLAYRSGWAMGSAAALSNTAIVVALTVVGVGLLGESLTAARAVGVALAAGGVWLAMRT